MMLILADEDYDYNNIDDNLIIGIFAMTTGDFTTALIVRDRKRLGRQLLSSTCRVNITHQLVDACSRAQLQSSCMNALIITHAHRNFVTYFCCQRRRTGLPSSLRKVPNNDDHLETCEIELNHVNQSF